MAKFDGSSGATQRNDFNELNSLTSRKLNRINGWTMMFKRKGVNLLSIQVVEMVLKLICIAEMVKGAQYYI